MKIIRPITVTDARLVSSTVAEPATVTNPDPAAWASGTTYAIDNEVHRTTTHRRYRSRVGSNLGNTPETSPTQWLDIGPTNRWAMFDTSVESQTTKLDSIVVEISPGSRVDSVALLNLDAQTVQVEATGYDQTVNLVYRNIVDWTGYFFEEFLTKSDVVFDDLPISTNNITITITQTTGQVAGVGVCVVGLSREIGDARYGMSLGIQDYSAKSTDAFGNTTVVQRSYSKRMRVPVYVRAEFVDELARLLTLYRSSPLVWMAAPDDYASSIVYGYYRDFDTVIAYPSYSECNLEIEGLI